MYRTWAGVSPFLWRLSGLDDLVRTLRHCNSLLNEEGELEWRWIGFKYTADTASHYAHCLMHSCLTPHASPLFIKFHLQCDKYANVLRKFIHRGNLVVYLTAFRAGLQALLTRATSNPDTIHDC